MNRIAKIGLGLGCLYLAAKIALRNLVVGLQGASFHSIDMSSGTASINLYISAKNPLPFGVRINRLVGDIYSQGTKVGYINTIYDHLLAAESIHTIPVIVNLTFSGVMRALWDNIMSGSISNLVIQFDGTIYVTRVNIGIPLEFAFNWEDIKK